VDRRGAVGQQEGRELGDLVGQARSSDRDLAERSHEPVARGVLVHIMLLAQPAHERGRGRRFDKSRRNRVHLPANSEGSTENRSALGITRSPIA
jgi:hypothetical protein